MPNVLYNMNMNNQFKKHAFEKFKLALEDGIGATLNKVIDQISLGNHFQADFYSSFKVGKREIPIVVEVKGHLTNLHQIKPIVDFSKSFDGVCMVVCEAITISLKNQLKELGLGYYEIGNELHLPLSLKMKNITTNKEDRLTSRLGYRTDSSLKILFYFVIFKPSLQFTQRELSERLGISLGAVNSALKNLERLGCIKVLANGKKLLGDFQVVSDRWRYQFLDVERRKLFIGRFSPINESFYSNWKDIDLDKTNSYWGGECAASLVTNYLTPGEFTIYTYENQIGELLKNLKIKKDPNGKIEILNAFWPSEINKNDLRTVPDFLIHADLLNSENSRNRETADYIRRKIINDENGDKW